MKRLMMYLKDYKKESILAPLFKLLEAFFELMVPLVMANIIDYGISNRNMGYIGKMGLVLLLLRRRSLHPCRLLYPLLRSPPAYTCLKPLPEILMSFSSF